MMNAIKKGGFQTLIIFDESSLLNEDCNKTKYKSQRVVESLSVQLS
jgi:hypothetical protein